MQYILRCPYPFQNPCRLPVSGSKRHRLASKLITGHLRVKVGAKDPTTSTMLIRANVHVKWRHAIAQYRIYVHIYIYDIFTYRSGDIIRHYDFCISIIDHRSSTFLKWIEQTLFSFSFHSVSFYFFVFFYYFNLFIIWILFEIDISKRRVNRIPNNCVWAILHTKQNFLNGSGSGSS